MGDSALSIFEQLRSKVMRPLATLSAPFAFGAFENADAASREPRTPAEAKSSADRHGPGIRVRPALRLAIAPKNPAGERADGPGVEVTGESIIRRARIASPGNGAGALPERRLMLAVLEDAIAIFVAPANSETQGSQRTLAEIQAWFAANDSAWPFSFVNICDVLDLSPERIRSALTHASDSAARDVVSAERATRVRTWVAPGIGLGEFSTRYRRCRSEPVRRSDS